MLEFLKDQIVYNNSGCQQCGICEAICPTRAISVMLCDNGLSHIKINQEKCIKCKKCISCCPANKKEIFKGYFSSIANKNYYLGYNCNNLIRQQSSSGGVCKTIIIEGLKSKQLDGVYSLGKCEKFPRAEGAFYTINKLPNYEDIPNSVYHSFMIGRNIDQVKKCNRLMIVGTSCQLKALENALKGKCNELVKICIFCKQQKSLDSTRFLAKVMGTFISGDLNFSYQYRGNGWPGIVTINNKKIMWDKAAQLPFGRRLWTVPGCNICGDPFGLGVNADITLMDPWVIRKPNDLGETLIIAHTERGSELLRDIPNLVVKAATYTKIEPALGLVDIRRKQQLVSYFRGEYCDGKIKWAGRMEQLQRICLQMLAMKLPKLPFIFYRIICKIPDWRNIILK